MRSSENAGEHPAGHQPHPDQTEVAELATKLAALPHDATALHENAPLKGQPAPELVSRRARHGWLWWIGYLVAWMAVVTLAVVAALRVFYHDGIYLLTWFNAFTRYVYLPAYICLLWAAWQRRGFLALASFAIVVCHLIWLAPDFVRDRRFDPPAAANIQTAGTSPSVRIFFANVLQHNRQFDANLQEAAAASPDVILFAEWGWAWNQAFKQSSLAPTYVHGASVEQYQHSMVNAFSKLPIESETLKYIDGRLLRMLDIRLGSETLRIIGLHAARPLYPDQRDYTSYWNQVLPLLSAETGPLVVIGDFNATQHSLVYKRLKALGLRSAHEVCGRGYATTWPNEVLGVSLIRIDQAFLSPQVECQRIMEGRGKGSDHQPLIVDVRLR